MVKASCITRLMDDTYTLDEVCDLLEGLQAVIKGDVDSELIHTAHTNILLLRQLFAQAEKWHLKLQVCPIHMFDLVITEMGQNHFPSGRGDAQALPLSW